MNEKYFIIVHIGFYKTLNKHSNRLSIVFRYILKIRRTEQFSWRIVLTGHLYFIYCTKQIIEKLKKKKKMKQWSV